MAPNDVNFRLSGDSGDAQRAWLEIIGVLQQTEKQIAKMGQRLETESKRGNQAMEKQLTTLQALRRSFDMLRNANAIIGGIRTAFNLLTGEMEAAVEAANMLRQPQIQYDIEMAKLSKNIPVADMPRVTQILKDYEGAWDRGILANVAGAISTREGLMFEDRAMAMHLAVQAGQRFEERAPERDVDTLKAIGVAAAKIYAADPTLQAELPGGAPDFTQALNFIVQATQTAAQEDPLKFAQNVMPTLARMVSQYGFSAQQAGGLLAATQTIASDPTGRLGSRTFEIAMEQYISTGRKYGVGMERAAEGIFNVPAIMAFMRGDSERAREARQYFTGGFDVAFDDSDIAEMNLTDVRGRQMGAAKFRQTMRNLLMGIGPVQEAYAEAFEELSPENVAREAAAKQTWFRTSPSMRRLRRELDVLAFEGNVQTMDPGEFDWGEAERYRNRIMAMAGITGIERSIRNVEVTAGRFGGWAMDPIESVREDIRLAFSEMSPYWMFTPDPSEMTPEWIRENIRAEDQETFQILLRMFQAIDEYGMRVRVVDEDRASVPSPDPVGALED